MLGARQREELDASSKAVLRAEGRRRRRQAKWQRGSTAAASGSSSPATSHSRSRNARTSSSPPRARGMKRGRRGKPPPAPELSQAAARHRRTCRQPQQGSQGGRHGRRRDRERAPAPPKAHLRPRADARGGREREADGSPPRAKRRRTDQHGEGLEQRRLLGAGLGADDLLGAGGEVQSLGSAQFDLAGRPRRQQWSLGEQGLDGRRVGPRRCASARRAVGVGGRGTGPKDDPHEAERAARGPAGGGHWTADGRCPGLHGGHRGGGRSTHGASGFSRGNCGHGTMPSARPTYGPTRSGWSERR